MVDCVGVVSTAASQDPGLHAMRASLSYAARAAAGPDSNMALTGILRMADGGMAMAQPTKTNQGMHPNSTNQWQQIRMYTPTKLLGHASLLMADDLEQPNMQTNSSQDPTVTHDDCLITDMLASSPMRLLHH